MTRNFKISFKTRYKKVTKIIGRKRRSTCTTKSSQTKEQRIIFQEMNKREYKQFIFNLYGKTSTGKTNLLNIISALEFSSMKLSPKGKAMIL